MNAQRYRRPLWKHPAALGLLGVALMIGGWNLSTWRFGRSERESNADRQVDELQKMSDDASFSSLLEQIRRNNRPAPEFELPGRLILFGGIALFAVAAYRMYTDPTGPPPNEDPEVDSEDAEEFVEG